MHQLIPSLVSGTLDEACEKLAEVAVANREKSAFDWGGLGESLRAHAAHLGDSLQTHASDLYQHAQPHLAAIKGFASEHPVGAGALAGAGLGAAYGGLTSLGRDPEERQTGHNMFTGALAGAGVGIGAGLLHQHLPPLLEQLKEQPAAPPAPTAPGAAPPSSTLAPGEFMHNGRKMRIRPGAPGLEELNAKIQGASSPSVPEAGLNAASNFMGGYIQRHPWLASLAGLDATGTLLGGAAQLRNPSGSLNPRDLKAGLPGAIANVGDHPVAQGLKGLQNASPQAAQGAAVWAQLGDKAPQLINPDYDHVTRDAINHAVAEGTPAFGRRPSPRAIGDIFRGSRPRTLPAPATSRLGRLWQGFGELGNRASLAMERAPGPRGWKGRLGGRAAVYGGIPFLQMLYDRYQQQQAQNRQLQQAIQQYAEPVR